MKPELSLPTQPAMQHARAALPVGSAPREAEQASRASQTPRAVPEAPKAHAARGRPERSEPVRADARDTRLEFSVDDSSGQTVVSIIDPETSEVLRQIPAEELLAIARQIEQTLELEGEMQGLFVADEA